MRWFSVARRLLLAVFLCLLCPVHVLAQAPGTCDPNHYADIQDTNAQGLPANFCAFAYLPWRVRLPDNPQHTIPAYTNALQNYYAKGSGSGIDLDAACPPSTPVSSDGHKHCPSGVNYLSTLGTKPTAFDQGGGHHPTYKASNTDPQVSLYCDNTAYGCSKADGTSFPAGTVLHFRIPPYARESGERVVDSDVFMNVIQPDGAFVDFGGCIQNGCKPYYGPTECVAVGGRVKPAPCNCQGWPDDPSQAGNGLYRDWQTGDALLSGGDCGHTGQAACPAPTPCNARMYGATFGSIVTDRGVNNGAVNAGDAQAALPVHWSEVQAGQINHALHVYASCFTPNVVAYPGQGAGTCSNTNIPTVPVGQHWYLNMTRTEIDAADPLIIPPFLRPFAYAAHEHGVYMLDTGTDIARWMTQPLLESAEPGLYSGGITQSFWWDWYFSNCGNATPNPCGQSGDLNLKMGLQPGQYLDWNRLSDRIIALDPCYARGACSDSVSDPQQGGTGCSSGQCGTPGCPVCPPPGTLIAAYPFSEGAGTATHSTLVPDLPMTLVSPGPTWAPGHSTTALQCNTSGGGGATLDSGFFHSTNLGYSWSMWLFPLGAAPANDVQNIINAGLGGTPAQNFSFAYGHDNAAFRQAAAHRLANGTWVVAQLPTALPLNTWSYVAATWDGVTLTLYLNGSQVMTTAAPDMTAPNGIFTVCETQATTAASVRVDDLHLFSGALTATQVQADFQGTTAAVRFPHHGIVMQ